MRELENCAEKFATLQSLYDFETPLLSSQSHHMGRISGGPDEMDSLLEGGSLDEMIAAKVNQIFKQENCNITKTAQRLSIDRNTVKRWLGKDSKAQGTLPH